MVGKFILDKPENEVFGMVDRDSFTKGKVGTYKEMPYDAVQSLDGNLYVHFDELPDPFLDRLVVGSLAETIYVDKVDYIRVVTAY